MKNIIITGASGGIGSAIASELDDAKSRLILVGNKHFKELKKLTNNLSTETVVYKCDLTKPAEIQKMIDDIIEKYKHIDGLVNCAGISLFKQIQDITPTDFDNVFDANLRSVFLLCSMVAKNMIFNKSGKIVNISSMWGVVGASMESLYSASKAGIINLTKSLAKELGPSGINVNCVCPGLIDTKMNANLSRQTIDELVDATPLSRIGTPKDVANLVAFLLDDKSSFITGQVITIDGGFSL